jgi:hypothetical protein
MDVGITLARRLPPSAMPRPTRMPSPADRPCSAAHAAIRRQRRPVWRAKRPRTLLAWPARHESLVYKMLYEIELTRIASRGKSP